MPAPTVVRMNSGGKSGDNSDVRSRLSKGHAVSYSRQVTDVLRTNEFMTWLEKLKDLRGKARIIQRIDRLAQGNPGDVKPVGQGVSELKLTYGPGYRVYYLQDGDRLILLLCGGDKSTQQKDIANAQELAHEWRADQKQEGKP